MKTQWIARNQGPRALLQMILGKERKIYQQDKPSASSALGNTEMKKS